MNTSGHERLKVLKEKYHQYGTYCGYDVVFIFLYSLHRSCKIMFDQPWESLEKWRGVGKEISTKHHDFYSWVIG